MRPLPFDAAFGRSLLKFSAQLTTDCEIGRTAESARNGAIAAIVGR
jgi:hypothetical protein